MYNTFYFKYNNLKFDDIVKLNTVKFMFRARNYSLPLNLKNLFKINSYNNLLFHRIKIRTQRKYFCISNIGPQLWNNLKKVLRLQNNLKSFSINYKKVLISLYYNT